MTNFCYSRQDCSMPSSFSDVKEKANQGFKLDVLMLHKVCGRDLQLVQLGEIPHSEHLFHPTAVYRKATVLTVTKCFPIGFIDVSASRQSQT